MGISSHRCPPRGGGIGESLPRRCLLEHHTYFILGTTPAVFAAAVISAADAGRLLVCLAHGWIWVVGTDVRRNASRLDVVVGHGVLGILGPLDHVRRQIVPALLLCWRCRGEQTNPLGFDRTVPALDVRTLEAPEEGVACLRVALAATGEVGEGHREVAYLVATWCADDVQGGARFRRRSRVLAQCRQGAYTPCEHERGQASDEDGRLHSGLLPRPRISAPPCAASHAHSTARSTP